jgi:hypothetical protein
MTLAHIASTVFFVGVVPAIITIALIKTFKGE